MGNLREFVLKKNDALMFFKCPCQNFTAPAWIGLDHSNQNYFIGFYLILKKFFLSDKVFLFTRVDSQSDS